MAPKTKLVYFNIRGRGELIRLTLHAGGVAFVDERIEFQDWPQRKDEAPNGKLPYVEIEGKKYGEVLPLVRFMAQKCNLQGKTEEERLYVDIILKQMETFRDELSRPKMDSLLNKAQRKYLEDKLRSETIPTLLAKFEQGLEIGGTGFILGESLTVADLALWDTVDVLLSDFPTLLDTYPKIKEHQEKLKGMQKIKKYLDLRPVTEL